MPLVLGRMRQQVTVELADVALRQRDRVIGRKDGLHHLGIAGDFLLIPGGERADPDVGQDLLDLSVAEPGARNAG